MKKRIPFNAGKYSTINNLVLFNDKISGDAFRLLQILLNNSDEWIIMLGFYSNKFNWTGHHQAKIIKELTDNGYLIVTKKSKGRGKGYEYKYEISEYGDLISSTEPEIETSIVEPIQAEIPPVIVEQVSTRQQEPIKPVVSKKIITEDDVIDSFFTPKKQRLIPELTPNEKFIYAVAHKMEKGIDIHEEYLIKKIVQRKLKDVDNLTEEMILLCWNESKEERLISSTE